MNNPIMMNYCRVLSFNHQTMGICSNNSSSTHNKLQLSHRPQILMADHSTIKDDHYHHHHHGVQRRTSNYKPNIWKYDQLQSLRATEFSEKEYSKKRIQTLKEEVGCMFAGVHDHPLSKLELIDNITKLGLNKYFEEEINAALDVISASKFDCNDVYATALCFRLLRHYGHDASEEMFMSFVDEGGNFTMNTQHMNHRAMIELFEASNMGREGENILQEAKIFSTKSLNAFLETINFSQKCNDFVAKRVASQAMKLPMQWGVEWYNVKNNINALSAKGCTKNNELIELANLNFNLVQASHQEDLKDLSRWWTNLGINRKLNFSRDRIVESFLFATGVAPEPQHGSLRKWLTKVIKLILIIDDVYDIYGSLEELKCFTNAVDRWNPREVKDLPECMKICFWALFSTTEQIAAEIQQEKDWNSSILPYLHNKWAEFCKSMLVEAKWYNMCYTPSLEDYLENAWISSSGPLHALLAILSVANGKTKTVDEYLKDFQDITYYSSLIIRLCNDQGTSKAELERGDVSSSISCYMKEAGVSEEAAREHIESLITNTWRKINAHSIKHTTPFAEEPTRYIINTARSAHHIYQNGDGFGIQDADTRDQVLLNFIEPL